MKIMKSDSTAQFARSILLIAAMTLTSPLLAQTPPGEGLGGIPLEDYANDVERRAALANQVTFNQLDPTCNPGGVFDRIANPDPSLAPDGCTGDVFSVYLTIRELVHSANEITGRGPTAASLGLDQTALGTALRWTAAEELAAQGSAASEFANNQLSNLAARLNALRFGARGFTVAGFYDPAGNAEGMLAANADRPRGGGASADGSSATYSSWGGFLNGSFGYGKKDDTDLENAFDFDGSEITLGLDYRFQNNFVLGGMVGYKQQTIDFDRTASAIRVVDGGMEVDGTSAMIFALFQGDRFYISGSVGAEKLDYAVDRRIKYASNNPELESANSVALSSPKADTITSTLNLGYAFHKNRLTFEPYLNAEYLSIDIDAFLEERSITPTGNVDDDAFNLQVGGQSFDSLDAVLGFRLQYTFTPKIGVIVPYAKFEAHNELLRESRTIFAGYGTLSEVNNGEGLLTFAVPTDEVDASYYTWALGMSTVLRGGRQRSYDGPITGGLMAFIQFEAVEELDNYEQYVISGGFRYEF